jgi:class 3 adenylate cyclase
MSGARSNPQRGIVTAMFTDIVNSTRLKSLMSADTAAGRDDAYRASIGQPHDGLVRGLTEEFGGRLDHAAGDGYLFTFDDVEQAVLCALALQESLGRNPIPTPLGPLQLRIGLHTGLGSLGPQTGGVTIDKAARVQASAAPGEVLVSHETHVLVSELRGVGFEQTAPVDLKGLGPQVLYRATRRSAAAPAADPTRLVAMENPYEFATTANPRTFKGRRDEVEELLASIESGTHTVVFGLQRMGKTSLIEQGLAGELQRRPSLRNGLVVASIDLQRLGGAQVTYKDFVHAIFESIVEALNAQGIGREVTNMRDLTRDLMTPNRYQRGDRTEFFSVFARVLAGLATASRRRIVVLIDEFSEIRKVIEKNAAAQQKNPSRTGNLLPHDMYIDVPFIHHMSSLLKDAALKKQIMFVVLVRPFLAEYDEQAGLQLLKLMKPIALRHLDEAAARELIIEPLEPHVSYEPGAVDLLYGLTAGHPYLLQFMLKIIVDRIRRDARPIITVADVQWLKERMIADGPAYDAHFAVLISDYSVDEVTHRKEAQLGRGLLALVSQLAQHQGGWAPARDIFDTLERQGVPPAKTASLLSQLTRTCILSEERHGDALRYRLSIPLVQERFVRQNLYLKYFRR